MGKINNKVKKGFCMGHDLGEEDASVTQNGYTYGDNNPVMLTNPDGQAPWLIPVAISGYSAYKGYKGKSRVN